MECMLIDVVVSDWCSATTDEVPLGPNFVNMDKPKSTFGCEVRLYGVTATGDSVCAHVRGFQPSLVFPATSKLPPCARVHYFLATRMDGWDPDVGESRFARVFFESCNACRKASKMPDALEANVDAVTQFYDMTSVRACGWVRIDGAPLHEKATHSVMEVTCDISGVRPLNRDDIAPMRVASFDIECVSETGDFPDKPELNDRVSCVGVHTWTHGVANSDAYTAFTVGNCAPFDVEGTPAEVRHFPNEASMLCNLREFWAVEANVHVFLSWNGAGFDYPFLWKRAHKQGADAFKYLSSDVFLECREREKKIASNQSGARDLFLVDTPGRVHIDAQYWFSKNRKCQSYALSAVSAEFLGADKIHLGDGQTDDYRALREKILSDDPGAMAEVNMYCLWDCVLPSRLVRQEQVIEGFVTTARTTFTNWQALVFGGETRKNTNMFVQKCHRASYVLAPVTSEMDTGKYEGATVLEPMPGYYALQDVPEERKGVVTALDFASLYPSIMRSFNLCPSTLVVRADVRAEVLKLVPHAGAFCFVVIEPGTCRILNDKCHWSEAGHSAPPKLHGKTFLVAFLASPLVVLQSKRGVTPEVLTSLIDERKAVRKRQAAATDPVEEQVLDALQKSIKVGANSVYGAFGADFGDMACKEIAALTTFLGRWMLGRTKEIAETRGAVVIYGDTDSIFALLSEDTIATGVARGKNLAAEITLHFETFFVELSRVDGIEHACYVDLEFEKAYRKFILLAKKRYVGLIEDAKGKTKMDTKGVAEARSDYTLLTIKLYREIRTTLLDMHSTEESVMAVLKAGLERVIADEVPFDDYRKSKKLNKTKAHEEDASDERALSRLGVSGQGSSSAPKVPQLPHWYVKAELEARGREAPRMGDRVYFVYVYKRGLNVKAFEMAKDPKLALEDGDIVHRSYYLTNELQGPLSDLLQFFGKERIEAVFKEAHDRLLCSSSWLLHAKRQRGLPVCSGARPPTDLRALCKPQKPQKKPRNGR